MKPFHGLRVLLDWTLTPPAHAFTLGKDRLGVGPIARLIERLIFVGASSFALLQAATGAIPWITFASAALEAKATGVVIAFLIQLALAVPTYIVRRLDGDPPAPAMGYYPATSYVADDGPSLATAGMPDPQAYEQPRIIPTSDTIRIPSADGVSPSWPS